MDGLDGSTLTRQDMTPARQGSRAGIFAVFRRGQTYRALLYLVLACPTAWVYWVVFSQGFQAGGEGGVLPFLFVVAALFVTSWYVAIFERALARWVLGVRFTPMAPRGPDDYPLWERFKAHLRNPVTWKVLGYLAVRTAFGIAVPVAAAVLIAFALLILLAPVIYLAAVIIFDAGWLGSHLTISLPPALAPYSGTLGVGPSYVSVALAPLAVSLVAAALGLLLLLVTLHLTNGMVSLWGRFARLALGMSDKEITIAEARAIAASANARADRADHSRRELILNASHELRTPIASIRAHIESLLLLEGERLPENVREFLAITQREAERLGTLVDELLMLARADTDELKLKLAPVAVGEVIEEVYHALGALAEREREVTLVREVAPDLPLALADRDRLAQVLLNLVRNAIAYTPAGGVVSITAAPDDAGAVALAVSDTGAGIAADDLERVFERFYRADASRARGTGGFGLGLSIVRDLVRAMGGTVVAERLPEGGSRFRVTLRAVGGVSVPARS